MCDTWSNRLNVTSPSSDVWATRHHDDSAVIRTHALGRFSDLLVAPARHPAMLRYLDASSSRRGAPNENRARELMELRTVGVGACTEAHGALRGPRADGDVASGLTELAQALAASHADLGEKTATTTVMTLSELGRRAAENGSGGRVHGRWPGLGERALDDGALAARPARARLRPPCSHGRARRGSGTARRPWWALTCTSVATRGPGAGRHVGEVRPTRPRAG